MLIDRFNIDLFQQDNNLNIVDLRLRLNRAKPQFYMVTAVGSSGKVVLMNMLILVKKLKPTPTVLNAINQRLNSETVKYPLRRVEVKIFNIPAGTQSKISIHLFQVQMPKRIAFGFVENAAFNGDNLKYSFHFKSYKSAPH